MGLLGQMHIWETIISVVLVVIFFNYIFTRSIISNKTDVFVDVILSRDFLLTLDTLNITYYAFSNKAYFENLRKSVGIPEFYTTFFLVENIIKDSILVAANCSSDEINKLSGWYENLKSNRREISLIFIESSLENVPYYADVLIICGYKNLTLYEDKLINLINKRKGIVGFFDVVSVLDNSSKRIFGIDVFQGALQTDLVEINVPSSVQQDIFYSYKLFYGFPIRIPVSSVNLATNNPTGYFRFRNYTIPFEINISSKEVYFNAQQRISVKEREDFYLYGYKFTLSYITNDSIFVSFKKVYNFTGFLHGNLIPRLIDDNESKVFLYQGYYDYRKVPVAVINGSKVAWIANFDRFNNATDDQKLALLSLILAVSNKEYSYGILTNEHMLIPFIELENYDFFELVSIKFGFSSIY